MIQTTDVVLRVRCIRVELKAPGQLETRFEDASSGPTCVDFRGLTIQSDLDLFMVGETYVLSLQNCVTRTDVDDPLQWTDTHQKEASDAQGR